MKFWIAVLGFLVIADTAARADDDDRDDDGTTIVVPAGDGAAIQAAVDRAATDTTIVLGPGTFAITTPIRVDAKRIRFRGAGAHGRRVTELVAAPARTVATIDQVEGLINFVDGGGGSVSRIAFHGGDAGIASNDPRATVAGSVDVHDVVISDTGRGVVWRSGSNLRVRNTEVTNAAWTGISISQVTGAISLSHVTIKLVFGAGIYVGQSPGCTTIDSVFVSGAMLGGISAKDTCIDVKAGLLVDNNFAGIHLWASTATVDRTIILDTKPFGAIYGDGVAVLAAGSAALKNMQIKNSARAGASVFGGTLSLAGCTLRCNAFDIDSEDLKPDELGPGNPASMLEAVLHDFGGNICGCGSDEDCTAVSSSLKPPAPMAGLE